MFRKKRKSQEDIEVEEIREEVKKETKSGAPQENPEKFKEQLHQTIFGVRFPWEAVFFVVVGALSEVVDAMFMSGTLDVLNPDLMTWQNILISGIVGAGCFFSMAFVGFQLGNRRYYTKIGEKLSYGFWASAGLTLVIAKLLAGLVNAGLGNSNVAFEELVQTPEFISQAIVALIQLVLYIGTGFMTRDSVKILTDNDLREYFLARRRYEELLDDLADMRGEIVSDISRLKAYHRYAKRLIRSKESVQKNVIQYNESARALIEAKMAISVEPDLMEDMYNNAMQKEEEVAKAKKDDRK